MGTLTLPIYISAKEQALATAFSAIYEPYLYQGSVENNRVPMRVAKKSKHQICRFCKRNSSDTNFTQDTHLISELIGNGSVYSEDECDECNLFFGKVESDLAAFLGLERTLEYPDSLSSAPKFESKNKGVGIKKFPSGVIVLYAKKEDNQDLKIDLSTGETHINMNTKPYRRTAVYQSLLKMALGVLPKELLDEYTYAFKFLKNPESWPGLADFMKVVMVKSEVVVGKPFLMMFQRLPESNQIYAEHICCIYCFGYMFQFIVPAGLKSIGKGNFDMPYAPYIQLGNQGFNQVVEERGILDLTSNEKEFRDTSIHFKMNVDVNDIVSIQLDKEFFDLLNK
jgi:hypothetical protein